ncbi:MAG TPA: hypothetical protein VE869_16030, partial [Gemmatimonas sp.]|nr:hypothetical protein [Gemmatimonas sp.]
MSRADDVVFRIGTYGSTVKVVRRESGMLALHYTRAGKNAEKSVRHGDVKRAEKQAKELSRRLLNERALESGADGATAGLTLDGLCARYTTEVSVHKKGVQADEDQRRRTIWLAVLKPNTLVMRIKPSHVRKFMALRRSGRIVVDGLNLRGSVKPGTVNADVIYLQSVFNWAVDDGLLTQSPIKGLKLLDVGQQLRPMASAERAAKITTIAHEVHPLFPLMFAAVRSLGWRISAICQIDGTDIRRTRTKLAPHGEIRKNWQVDKESQGQWLPMPRILRDALDAAHILAVRGFVFPSPLDPNRPMSRHYANALLERAESKAKLVHLEGGAWHPFGRPQPPIRM